MTALGLGDIAAFPFVEAPDKRQIQDGVRLLEELGALAGESARGYRLSPLGRQLAQLPLIWRGWCWKPEITAVSVR